MQRPTPVTHVLIRLLNVAAHHLGERLGQALQRKSCTSSFLFEQVKSDPRYLQVQVEYLQRKEVRDRELSSLPIAQVDRKIQLQEQELQDRCELSKVQRKLLREFQAKSIQLKLNEIQTLWHKDPWFSQLSWPNTDQILQRQQHRLLLLIAPPTISRDCPDSFHNNLEIELRKVGEFISLHYPLYNELCPVEFYSDFFRSPISDLDVKRLQPILSLIPTAIIYSDISDYEVNLRVGFWGLQNNEVFLLPTQAWNWEKELEELETAGYNQKQSLRLIREVIVTIHKLLSAFLVDLYYLNIDPHYQPKLFDVESELDRELVKPYIKILKEIQQQQREIYQQELEKLAEAEAKRREEEELKQKAEKWRCLHTLAGHSNWVCCLAISPNGQMFASGSSDNTIKLWNLQTGQEIHKLAGHSDRVNSVTFSPDGQTLASDSSDKTIKLWNLQTGQEICTITGNSSKVFPVILNTDQTSLTSGSEENIIKLWNLKTVQEIGTNGIAGKHFPFAMSPDGETIATAREDNTIKLWNLKTGQEIFIISGHSQWVTSVAFSPDGQTLASGGVDDTIKLWNWKTGQEIFTLTGHTHWVNSVTFSPDRQILFSGSMDRTIKLWNLKIGKEIRTMTEHAGGVIAVAISLDGKTMVSGSTDGVIKIWRCN